LPHLVWFRLTVVPLMMMPFLDPYFDKYVVATTSSLFETQVEQQLT